MTADKDEDGRLVTITMKNASFPVITIYFSDLLQETIRLKESKHSNEVVSALPDVPENIAPVPKPDKREAIKSIRTRFSVNYP